MLPKASANPSTGEFVQLLFMECFKESAWKSTSRVALREDACKGKRFEKATVSVRKVEKMSPKACAEGPRRVLDGVWRLLGRPSERHGARRRGRNRSEASKRRPGDAQDRRKADPKRPKGGQELPKATHRESKRSQEEGKWSPRGCRRHRKRGRIAKTAKCQNMVFVEAKRLKMRSGALFSMVVRRLR